MSTSEATSSNKRVAKNTLVLYLRMIFIFCVGLFTSRIVLNTLGVVDFGVYNVVGGFVALFTFLNGAMATATQRFITFELVSGDLGRQKATFATAILIHFALATLIFILAETVGLWFVTNKLVIPEERFSAALVVYELSILSCCVSVISLPYNAAIIAHEKMSAFAYISVMDTVLKLGVVFLLQVSPWDKLILYAVLLFLIQLLDRLIYGIYCSRHFQEVKFEWTFDKRLLKDMSNIAGWSLFGNLAGVGYTQGLNILLNLFFGPAVNAARAVAVTVQGAISGFVSNFQMAINPQITKTYAASELRRMHNLMYASSKFSFFMLFIIVLPIIIEAQSILSLWLKIVPDHSVSFLRLTLCIMLIETLSNPMMIASQATGKVKSYQCIVGGTLLMIVPIAYLVLKLGGDPESVFFVHFIIALIAQTLRLFIVSRQIQMSLREYCLKVLVPIILVVIVSAVPSYLLFIKLPNTLINALIIVFATMIISLTSVYFLGLSQKERTTILDRARESLSSFLRKA